MYTVVKYLKFICLRSSSTGVSVKSVGEKLPAQHHTPSGGVPLVIAVASETILYYNDIEFLLAIAH